MSEASDLGRAEEQADLALAAPLRVVAVGASAGGLDAFVDLLSAIPGETGLAFILVQHLDPHHESMLVDLLTKTTAIPVQQVEEGMLIERDHVYVIPPDREMTVSQGVLHLAPRTSEVPHRPLDNFFVSLAADQDSAAIGVILSGNDADGSAGLQAIRDAGGITFAQDESAKFAVMPRTAAGAADFVLPPRGIAEKLIRIAQERDVPVDDADVTQRVDEDPTALESIFQLLREHYQVDFHHYKQASVQRRVLRRVLLGGFSGLTTYADSLKQNSSELERLYLDLLIGVTSFFRDPAHFDALREMVFPELVKGKTAKDSIRVWVAGCSTGEEVYSLAMTLIEFLGDRDDAPKIAIYGTDINENALDKARAAIYADRALANVSPERLHRFFTVAAGGYKITKEVRRLCVFARQDVTRDPPFSKIDLVTCCNVLIYFGPLLQKKAIALLHYALASDGFLILGPSENLRGSTKLFVPFGTNTQIYCRQPMGARSTFDFDVARPRTVLPVAGPPAAVVRATATNTHDPADSFLVSHLAPCGVLVNDQMEITRFRGDVSPYLSLSPGEATFGLFHLIRYNEVLAELRPAMRRAMSEGGPVSKEDIVVTEDHHRRRIAFEVVPYRAGSSGPNLYWVLFHEVEGASQRKPKRGRKTAVPDELSETEALRQALTTVIEDRERLADEAGAAAEEAQSSDEELRSTNEELETAKEELQSANEELSTLNDELRNRNSTLTRMNDDLENLLSTVEIPILFVGVDLCIRRFNMTARMLLNLDGDSAGRPLGETRSPIGFESLERLVSGVIETGIGTEVEIEETGGRWRLARIRPYRTSDGNIDGAIIALVDIDTLKRSVLVAENTTRHATMLSEASQLLASSLDYETTLVSLTRLATNGFCDWCAVDLLNDDGTIRHLTVWHANPVLRELALEFQKVSFSEPEIGPGGPQALRLRKSVLLSDVAEWQLSGIQPEPKITQLIGALGVRSLISVPLILRDKVFGTTTFSSAHHRYERSDLGFAEELSHRAAIAVDTAMLFREAENANRYKDGFLGTVAHELRTPLTSIIGWVQLANQSPGDPDLKGHALVQIERSASLLKVFVEDLLDISRIQQQKLGMTMSEIDLVPVINSALDMTEVTAKEKGIQIACRETLSSATVLGDSVRLLQVVWNLLANAIKFTPQSGEIDVRLERSGQELRLTVSDTGIGISSDFLPHVFEVYRQADVSGRSTGLGIGLSIVSQVVKLHGGSVLAESAGIGKGSTFTLTLPLVGVPVDAVVVKARRSGDRKQRSTKGRGSVGVT